MLLVGFGMLTKAQTISTISKTPSNANGYLILNQTYYNTVTSWDVKVKEKVWNDARNQFEYTTVMSNRIMGTNYIKIPAQYRTANYVVDITGSDNTGTVVSSSDLPIGPVTETICSWICNGPNYVYALQMNDVPFQGVKISMQPAPPPSDAPYYYEWVQAGTSWNTFINTQNPLYYGFSSWGLATTSNSTGDQIIQLNVPAGQYKYDRFGTPMNGNVIGVAKYFGPYHQTQVNVVSDPLFASESDCAQPISWAIGLVNMGSTNPTTVSCTGTSSNTHFTPGEVPLGEIADPISADPCLEDYYDYIGWHAGSGSGVYQLIQVPCNEFVTNPITGTGSGTGIEWPASVSKITMKSLNIRGASTEISLTREDVFDDAGNFRGINHLVPAGFYNVLYQYEDLSIGSYFVEVTQTTNSVIEDKDFLTYSTYPVPIVGNDFNMSFESSKRLSFTYELRDARGNLLFQDNFDLAPNIEVIKTIQPVNQIPTGLLFNKIKFLDGSTINFTTVK